MALDVPEPSKGDALHALAKAGISLLPIAGGPGVEFFQHLIQPPLEKRRIAWMGEVGQKLRELEERGLDLSALQVNEQFITAVMQASAAAIRTHQQAKLNALKNAVVNIALGESADETFQHLLLGFIDEFTEMHLRLLAFAKAPVPPAGLSMGGLSTVLEDNIPTLRGQVTLYNQLWKDLYTRGLVNTESLNGTMSLNGLSQSRLSPIGITLLNLITERQD
jgi:hypothetical protein